MKYSELFRILTKDGWFTQRQSGGHLIMKHPTKPNQIVIPYHASQEIKKGTLLRILKDAGIKLPKK